MLGSFKIGRVLGITVKVHWTFLVLPFIALMWSPFPPLLALLMFVMLFGVVFLHELGHSVVARFFGIQVVDITFWPLGGMARMSDIPESPMIEGLIAIAGPAVNFVLAAMAAVACVAVGVLRGFDDGLNQAAFSWGFLSWWFVCMNLILGIFNLVPAFPMDGGRVLRAFLGIWSDWLSATRRAVNVGRVFAALMIVGSFVLPLLDSNAPSLFPLPLIGVFVWFGGTRELWAVRMRHGDIPGFAGPRPAHFEPRAPGAVAAGSPDPSGARRPTTWSGDPRTGLDADAIARLESYQGRLRNAAPPEQP